MNIGKAIHHLLSNYSDLTDLIGDRIYPTVAAQQAARPYVYYEDTDQEPVNRLQGRALMDQVYVDVTAVADTHAEVTDVAMEIRNALDRASGDHSISVAYGGVNVGPINFTGAVGPQYNDDEKTYIYPVSFRISQHTGE